MIRDVAAMALLLTMSIGAIIPHATLVQSEAWEESADGFARTEADRFFGSSSDDGEPPVGATAGPVASGAEMRVVVHYPVDGPQGENAARQVVDALERAAVRDIELRPVDVTVRSPSIRYFHDADRPASEALRRFMQEMPDQVVRDAAEFRLLDLRSYEPKPRLRTIEVWLSSGP